MKRTILIAAIIIAAVAVTTMSCKKANEVTPPNHIPVSSPEADTPYLRVNATHPDTPYLPVAPAYADTPYLKN